MEEQNINQEKEEATEVDWWSPRDGSFESVEDVKEPSPDTPQPPKWDGPGSSKPLVDINADYLKRTTQIKGWLKFFIVVISIGLFFNFINMIDLFWWASRGLVPKMCCVFQMMEVFVNVYAIYAFVERKPDAVFMSKVYVVSVFVNNLLFYLLGGSSELGVVGHNAGLIVIWSLAHNSAWFLFLSLSDQVSLVIPECYRKITTLHYVIVAALIVVGLVSFFVGRT